MDRAERIDEVRADLEGGQGCTASKLLLDLPPAERLAILKQAVAANHADEKATTILNFSDPDVNGPLPSDAKLVWLTVREKDSAAQDGHPSRKPATLIGFNDLTILPCKNNGSHLFW